MANIVCYLPGQAGNPNQDVYFANALQATMQAVFGEAVRCFRDMPLDLHPEMVCAWIACTCWYCNCGRDGLTKTSFARRRM